MKTVEEKAKAYDEAIKRAKGVIEQNPLREYLKKGIEYIFPELSESEDERIRKELISHFDDLYHDNLTELPSMDIIESWIAWLEKQGEHKSAWTEEDDEHLERILKELESQYQKLINRPYLDKIESDYNWLKSLRPQNRWKPSDEQMGELRKHSDNVILRNLYYSLKKLKE